MRIWERARCGAKGGLGEDWVRAGSHPSHFPACHPQLLSGLSKLQNFLLSWDLCLLGAWALPSPPEGSTEAQRAEIMNQPAGVQHMEQQICLGGRESRVLSCGDMGIFPGIFAPDPTPTSCVLGLGCAWACRPRGSGEGQLGARCDPV